MTKPALQSASTKLADTIARLALSKKSERTIKLDVRELTTLTDYFLICSADTDIQVRAISEAVRRGTDHKPYRTEGVQQANWIILDYLDVVLHIFKTDQREYYNLERLWADAPMKEYIDEPDKSFIESAD
ncbi:MAG: ribosome silencing factor [Candidatus Neomarinimicrobiota bacterium]